jgi:hypothetical protein
VFFSSLEAFAMQLKSCVNALLFTFAIAAGDICGTPPPTKEQVERAVALQAQEADAVIRGVSMANKTGIKIKVYVKSTQQDADQWTDFFLGTGITTLSPRTTQRLAAQSLGTLSFANMPCSTTPTNLTTSSSNLRTTKRP